MSIWPLADRLVGMSLDFKEISSLMEALEKSLER
jgi:hypothetical protein